MKYYFELVKALLRQSYRVDHSLNKKGKKSKTWVIYLIAGIACLPLAVMFIFVSYSIGQAAYNYGVGVELFTILIFACQALVLFFGIVTLLNNVYFSKDAEIVLSLPIRPAVAYAAKMTIVYFCEIITVVFFLFFCFIPFGVGVNASVLYYFMLIPIALIIPLIPLLLASIISIPLMYVVSFFKSKAVLSSIASILMFVIVFGGYMLFVYSMAASGGETGGEIDLGVIIAQAIESLKSFANAIYPDLVLAKAALATSFVMFILNFGISLGINLATLALTIYISSLVYTRSISKQLETPKSSSKKKGIYSGTGYTVELIKKEWRGIIRFPSLASMCLMQIVFAPLMSIIMLIPFSSSVSGEEGAVITQLLATFPDVVAFILVAMLSIFAISMNYAAMGAITREGENFFIMKIIPVSVAQQLDAKAFLSIIFNAIPTVISCVVFGIVTNLNILYILLAFVVTTLFGIAMTYLQITLDLKKPNIKWDNISQGMKNNHSSIISTIIGFGAAAVIAGIGFLTAWGALNDIEFLNYIFWGLMLLVGLVGSYFSRDYLLKNATKLIDKIEP